MEGPPPKCPTCGKQVRHRKFCPVQRRIDEKAALLENTKSVKQGRHGKQRCKKSGKQKEREAQLEREREDLRLQYPNLVNYIEVLEEKLKSLEGLEERVKELEYRIENPTTHCIHSYTY
jgi:hypothetical protein